MNRSKSFSVRVLGSGTSHGVPMIGCECKVCLSDDPRDKRMRASIAVESELGTVIVDTGPEFRLQCIAHNIRRCDAVLYTHHHIDHVAGLDDLRRFNWLQKGGIPCFAQAETILRLRGMFPYVDDAEAAYPSAKPNLEFRVIEGPVDLVGLEFVPIPLLHGTLPVLGFRVGRFAYCTDVSIIPDTSWRLLEGLDVLILDGLRRRAHPTHFNIDQAVEAARRINAKVTCFTHIAHELMHASTCAELPSGMALAHDGQKFELR